MGVVYKLKPKVKNYILKKKSENPNLSCRKISDLLEKKFQIKISKSAVNSLAKEAGLSMPIGRRQKRKKVEFEIEPAGIILLKAVDALSGGIRQIADLIQDRLKVPATDIQAKLESVVYQALFERPQAEPLPPDYALGLLMGRGFNHNPPSSYLTDLQGVKELYPEISKLMASAFQEIRCIKIGLATETNLYLDGSMHTLWTTANIPYDFSTTICSAKSYIDRYFQKNAPFIFFMAPGYDIPKQEFLEFISVLDSQDKELQKLVLLNHKLEEVGTVRLLEPRKRRFYLFGLWPWQFVASRKVRSIGQLRPFHFAPGGEDFYLAETEVELSQPNTNQSVTLKGCALKTRVWEKERVFILSNLPQPETTPEELAYLYLSHWPSLEEAFQDLSRKIELFTYQAASQRFFSTENLNLGQDASGDINQLMQDYLKILDLYIRWHFLPSGYEAQDFPTMNEAFYGLKARVRQEKNSILVTFQPPEGYGHLNELEYLCRRMNEREIIFSENRRLWCKVSS